MNFRLSGYFQSIAKFDNNQARKDLEGARGWHQTHNGKIKEEAGKVEKNMAKLFEMAITMASAELAENAYKLGLRMAGLIGLSGRWTTHQ